MDINISRAATVQFVLIARMKGNRGAAFFFILQHKPDVFRSGKELVPWLDLPNLMNRKYQNDMALDLRRSDNLYLYYTKIHYPSGINNRL
jgi:hypothetical protein